ncbi:MAG: hypothetical protein ACOY3I_01290 [Verrucomicrobiota bacterium]
MPPTKRKQRKASLSKEMLKTSLPIPEGYLRFSKKEPLRCVEKIYVDNTWIALLKPLSDWPKELLAVYQQDLYFLFPKTFSQEVYNSRDLVCLCCTVHNCPKKTDEQIENRECTEYRRGLCVEASVEANDCKPLSLGAIARFYGLSKQRVFQIYKDARKHLILELAHDETMQEYLADIFIGNRTVPTPEEIANFIEQAIEGKSEEE